MSTATTIRLRFPLAEAMELAEHAVYAPEHVPDWAQVADGITTVGPALHWVTDAGTYLMSNGLPGVPDPTTGGSRVVYAIGWGQTSDRQRLGESAVGHDDDVTALALGDPADPKSLIALLRRARDAGGRWLVLTVSDDDVKLEIRA